MTKSRPNQNELPKGERPEDTHIERSKSKTQLTEDGRERPNPRPIAPPPGYVKAPSISEQIRTMVQRELSQAAANNDMETFEEADDFDMPDDPLDPRSPYEVDFDPVHNLFLQAKAEHEESLASAAAKAAAPLPPEPGPAPATPATPPSDPKPK